MILLGSQNDWSEHPEKFRKVVDAIAASELRKSLKSIFLKGCKIDIALVQQMLNENNLKKIKACNAYVD